MDWDKALYDFMETHEAEIIIRPARGGFEATLIEDEFIASGDGARIEDAISEAVTSHQAMVTGMIPNRKWTKAYKDKLPDTAFLYVDKKCATSKDEQGRSHPLSCRHLPVKDLEGRYDFDHVRNAMSRAMQVEGITVAKRRELQAKAREIFYREFP